MLNLNVHVQAVQAVVFERQLTAIEISGFDPEHPTKVGLTHAFPARMGIHQPNRIRMFIEVARILRLECCLIWLGHLKTSQLPGYQLVQFSWVKFNRPSDWKFGSLKQMVDECWEVKDHHRQCSKTSTSPWRTPEAYHGTFGQIWKALATPNVLGMRPFGNIFAKYRKEQQSHLYTMPLISDQ